VTTDSVDPRRGRPIAAPVGRLRGVVPVLALLVAVATGCQLGEGPSPAAPPTPEPAVLEGPALADGPTDEAEARVRSAAQLMGEARAALDAGNPDEALQAAEEIEAQYADVPGTLEALWLQARAHRELEAWEAADGAVDRFLARGPGTEEERVQGLLLRADVRISGGLDGGLESLFQLPDDASESILEPAEALAVETADAMTLPVLRDLLDEAPRHPRLYPAFQVEMAVRRALMGDMERSRELASAALELSPGPAVAERARNLAAGRLDDLDLEMVSLGALLSEGGPPSLRNLSQEIREGIEVALADAEGQGLPVRFQVMDDQASPGEVARLVRELEQGGAAGMLGPLDERGLQAAAEARQGALPLISPTARGLPAGRSNVFSLTGVDPSAPRALAQLARDAGVGEVVILHPRTPEMEEEARFFREAFQERGGLVRRTLVYPPGTTSFAEPFQEVVRLAPQGLVLLLPPDQVQMVAPQVAYFGVDDLEITLLGNEVWSTPAVLEEVNPRHTDGVLTVSAGGGAGRFGPGWDDFVDRYEQHFQRTLRSPVPALGYDAARLLMHAAREGGGSPEGTAEALARIRDFPGATGLISVVDGRIQRSYTPVRLQGREALPFRP